MAGDIKAWIYTDDEGNSYVRRVAAYLTTQLDGSGNPVIGGRAYTGTPVLPPFPRSIKPRHVTAMAAGYRPRQVVCMTADAPLYTGAVTTVQLHDGNGTSYAATRNSAEGEKRRKMSPGG